MKLMLCGDNSAEFGHSLREAKKIGRNTFNDLLSGQPSCNSSLSEVLAESCSPEVCRSNRASR